MLAVWIAFGIYVFGVAVSTRRGVAYFYSKRADKSSPWYGADAGACTNAVVLAFVFSLLWPVFLFIRVATAGIDKSKPLP